MNLPIKFTAKVWVYPGDKASWYFVTLPNDTASDIKEITTPKPGFGSIKVIAGIGKTRWSTSIFPDSNTKSFLLPIRKEVRIKNSIVRDQIVAVNILIAEN